MINYYIGPCGISKYQTGPCCIFRHISSPNVILMCQYNTYVDWSLHLDSKILPNLKVSKNFNKNRNFLFHFWFWKFHSDFGIY